jgi:hypothetical protein
MVSKYSYGYLKEAVKAHLDFEEDEMEAMNINSRFHIFANEAINQMCYTRPKYTYFQFTAVSEFAPLVYDDGELREATGAEITANTMTFANDDELADYYNDQDIYLVGQVITPPNDFLSVANKKAFVWTDSLANRIEATKEHILYLSNSEFVVKYAATYQIPYRATWLRFAADDAQDALVDMPSDLLLTIPIYVASIILQQRNQAMAQAKRQEFEIAVSRCRSNAMLENMSVTPTFK